MTESSSETGDPQAALLELLVSRVPENYATMVFRAEMRKDSGKITSWYTLSGSDAHQVLRTDAEEYRLCRKILKTMAEPAGEYWKVMLLQIDAQNGQFKAEFEYKDPSRWDTAKYRSE